MRAFVVSVSIV